MKLGDEKALIQGFLLLYFLKKERYAVRILFVEPRQELPAGSRVAVVPTITCTGAAVGRGDTRAAKVEVGQVRQPHDVHNGRCFELSYPLQINVCWRLKSFWLKRELLCTGRVWPGWPGRGRSIPQKGRAYFPAAGNPPLEP